MRTSFGAGPPAAHAPVAAFARSGRSRFLSRPRRCARRAAQYSGGSFLGSAVFLGGEARRVRARTRRRISSIRFRWTRPFCGAARGGASRAPRTGPRTRAATHAAHGGVVGELGGRGGGGRGRRRVRERGGGGGAAFVGRRRGVRHPRGDTRRGRSAGRGRRAQERSCAGSHALRRRRSTRRGTARRPPGGPRAGAGRSARAGRTSEAGGSNASSGGVAARSGSLGKVETQRPRAVADPGRRSTTVDASNDRATNDANERMAKTRRRGGAAGRAGTSARAEKGEHTNENAGGRVVLEIR